MKYRRIEVNAFRRRVTIVSGEWPRQARETEVAPVDGVSLNDTDSCEPVEPESPEGQLILLEAVRSLEQRLSPEARAAIRSGLTAPSPNGSNQNRCYLKLQSLYRLICPTALRLTRKEK
ncbi:MAG: hypothetical protein ACRD9S_02965 [Pyrinomonadaceae bacterium]